MKRVHAILLVILISIGFSTESIAEATFITDKISVDLYSLQNQKGVIIKSIPSGSPVEVLKTDGEYFMVRTSDNKTGWVPAKMVTSEKPIQIEYLQLLTKYNQLKEQPAETPTSRPDNKAFDLLKQAHEKAQDELKRANAQIKKLEESVKDKNTALSDSNSQLEQFKNQLAQEQQKAAANAALTAPQAITASLSLPIEKTQPAPLPATSTDQEVALALKWVAIAMLVTLLLGFMWGKHWVDQKIRKRHGGIRIY